MMTTSGSSSSLSRCTRRSRSFESPDENGDRKVKELEKSKSFPAIRQTKPSTFNFRAKIEEAKKWMQQWTTLYATFQLTCMVELKNDDATTQEVHEDSSDKRQPLGQQLQPPKSAQADSHLTNERTSNGAEDTSPIDSTHAHDEDGFGARQPLRQQQNFQNTHRTLALTYERTSDTTNYRSPLDHRISIVDKQLPVQGQTSQINIGDQQLPVQGQTSHINIGDQQPPVQGQTSQINIGDQQPPVQGQTSQINIGDQQPPVQGQTLQIDIGDEQPSMQGETSHNAITDLCSIYDRTSNEDYNLPYRSMLVLLLLILIAALQFQPIVGLKDDDETTTKDLRTGQTIGAGREHNDLNDGHKSAAVDDDKVLPLQVDEDSLDFRQSLRTFEDTKDTSPSNSTYAIHEIELGSIQPWTQQHAPHDAHQSSPVTDERTSDVTGHLSSSDHIVTIHGDELDAIQPLTQRQTSTDAYQRTSDVPDHVSPSDHIIMIRDNELDAVHRLTQLQTSLDAYQRTPDITDHASPSDHSVMINGIELGAAHIQTSLDIHRSTLDERMSTNGTDQMVPSNSTLLANINNRQQQNPLHGFLSRVAPSTDDRIFGDEPNYIALFFYAHVIIGALPFLLGLLYLILPIG